MKIIVFGLENEDAILSRLRKRFPSVGFLKYDKSIELEEEGPELIALDSVKGIEGVSLIDDLDSISPGKAVAGSDSMITLRILLKIGSLKSVKIIAVQMGVGEQEAFDGICLQIQSLSAQPAQ
jgi:hypothetical protein